MTSCISNGRRNVTYFTGGRDVGRGLSLARVVAIVALALVVGGGPAVGLGLGLNGVNLRWFNGTIEDNPAGAAAGPAGTAGAFVTIGAAETTGSFGAIGIIGTNGPAEVARAAGPAGAKGTDGPAGFAGSTGIIGAGEAAGTAGSGRGVVGVRYSDDERGFIILIVSPTQDE